MVILLVLIVAHGGVEQKSAPQSFEFYDLGSEHISRCLSGMPCLEQTQELPVATQILA